MTIFAMMNKEMQISVPIKDNPLLSSLERKARRFQMDAVYYDYGEPIEFNQAFGAAKADVLNVETLEAFNKFLARRLIADVYHVNSYVQESLVDVYRTVETLLDLLGQPRQNERACSEAEDLFYRLTTFEDRLEDSLQRGPVLWGFLKARKCCLVQVVKALLLTWCLHQVGNFVGIFGTQRHARVARVRK
jgi:hypothetical protein